MPAVFDTVKRPWLTPDAGPAMGVRARPLKITAVFICAVLSLAMFWLSGREA
jgi:hypothetical protein